MASITPEDIIILKKFLRSNSGFLKALGPSGKKSTAPAKCKMNPMNSMWYAPSLQVLRSVFGDERYTKAEFTRLLGDLGYAFNDDKGHSKGSARDYLKPLHGFVDGYMKTCLKATSGVDTTECNMIRQHLNPPRDDAFYSFSLTRMVDKFEQESGNSGHGRMKQSIPFILAAQMMRMKRVLEEQGIDMDEPCSSHEVSRKRPREGFD